MVLYLVDPTTSEMITLSERCPLFYLDLKSSAHNVQHTKMKAQKCSEGSKGGKRTGSNMEFFAEILVTQSL